MKRFVLILKLMLLCLFVWAQQPLLNEVYEDYEGNSSLSIIAGPEGYTLIGEGYSLVLGGNAGIKTMRIDEFGYLSWKSVYGQATFDYLAGHVGGTFKTQSGQSLISFGSFCDSNQTCKGLILKQTINGDTIWSRRFGSIKKSILQKGLELSNGDFVGVGFTSALGIGGQIWLVKTDSSGNLLWQKHYGGSGFEEAKSLIQTSDKGFILAGRTSSKGAGSYDAYIVKVDSFGNFEWDRTYGDSSNDYSAKITASSDGGNYLYWTSEDNELGPGLRPTYEKRSYLTKIDSIGNIVWQKVLLQDYFEWAYVYQLKEVNGGRQVILAGSKKSTDSLDLMGWVMKLDSSGNRIWERYYTNDSNPGSPNFIYDFEFIANDGMACTGVGHTPGTIFANQQNFWLLVLDSMGCLVPGCDTITGITETTTLQAKLYPNPTTGALTIELPGGQGGNMALYNLLGQSVYQATLAGGQTTLTLNLPPGLYLYRIGSGGKAVNGKLLVE